MEIDMTHVQRIEALLNALEIYGDDTDIVSVAITLMDIVLEEEEKLREQLQALKEFISKIACE